MYDHLLSPLKVGNRLFKNRIVMTPTTPQFFQEDEPWPAENLMQHYWLRAKNGAALITLSGLYQFNDTDNPMPEAMRDYFQFDIFGLENHYLAQLVEGIHAYGSYVTIQMQHDYPVKKDISAGATPFGATFMGDVHPADEELTEADIRKSTEDLVEKCLILKRAGLDGIFMHMSYQQMLTRRSLSPLINKRTDRYGGSFEKRLTLVRETCDEIKKACGKDFLIEAHITGEERDAKGELIPGGWTIDDSIRFAEAMSGYIDILHLRGWNIDEQHPLWIRPDEPPYLYLAERCKEAVTDTKILCTAGNKNPEMMDAAIAEGKTDLIGMARQLIADPYFIQKLYEKRPEDIRPCIRCNRCFEHGPKGTPRTSRCTINPLWGHESRVHKFITPAEKKCRVAIAGGGPAGMEAAIVAAKRGHDVTIFEKGSKLGGQLNIADFSPRKWGLRQYRDHLKGQIDKLDIPVRFGEKVTPEILDAEDYDVVIAAMGSHPKMPAIEGVDRPEVRTIMDVYGKEGELGRSVVIVGGGSTAAETAWHLADEYGLDVTLLGRNAALCKDMPPTHNRVVLEAEWANCPGLTMVTQATVTAIDDDGVHYTDAGGTEHVIPADDVVIAAGMEAPTDEVMSLHGHDARVIAIGDCRKPASIMELARDAWFAASQI